MANVKYYANDGVREVSPESRGGRIAAEVNSRRSCFWESYDQGRMANAMGDPMSTNRNSEWIRGWRAEAAAV